MKHRQRGFTLIEVMVAIALMAIVSIIAWRGLENVSSQQRRLTAEADDVDAIIRMLGQMERDVTLRAPDDLASADTAAGDESGGADKPPPAEGGAPKAPVSPLPKTLRVIVNGNPDSSPSIELIRNDAADPGAWQRVIWFLDGDVLRRAAGLPARQYPIPPAEHGAAILGFVQRFAVRGWISGQGWINTPFPASSAPITGLELSVERVVGDSVERYSRVMVLE